MDFVLVLTPDPDSVRDFLKCLQITIQASIMKEETAVGSVGVGAAVALETETMTTGTKASLEGRKYSLQ